MIIGLAMPASATGGDPLTVVNNLSDFIFGMIRAIGLILLNWIWNIFKNFGLVAGLEAEDPIKLSIRSVLFIFLAYVLVNIIHAAISR